MKNNILLVCGLLLVIVGCTTAEVKPNPDPTQPPLTNWIVDPKLTTGLATAGAVNAATAAVNPFSPAVEIGLGAIAALAAWVAKRKNDAAAQKGLLLKTVIQGVENSGSAEVKGIIQKQAIAIGVEGELSTTVQKVNSGAL